MRSIVIVAIGWALIVFPYLLHYELTKDIPTHGTIEFRAYDSGNLTCPEGVEQKGDQCIIHPNIQVMCPQGQYDAARQECVVQLNMTELTPEEQARYKKDYHTPAPEQPRDTGPAMQMYIDSNHRCPMMIGRLMMWRKC